MKARKIMIASALSLSLVLGATPAFAVQMNDVASTAGEISINKVVSLGVMAPKGSDFLPDEALTRKDFATIASKLVYLPQGKNVAFTDLKANDPAYAAALKLVNNGFLTAGGKAFGAAKSVTFAELSRVLAYGLGLKSSWTTRPVDALYYLERRGVLDITTDLDEVVTREDAAIAFDKYIAAKGTFEVKTGIVVKSTEKGLAFNDGGSIVAYPFASGASFYVSGNESAKSSISIGSPVTITLDKKNQIAFVESFVLDNFSGTFALTNGEWVLGGTTKKVVNLDAYIAPLPDEEQLTITSLNNYQGEGVTFGGTVFFSTDNDEVTSIKPYMAKIADKSFTIAGDKIKVVVVAGSEEDGIEEVTKAFALTADTKVVLDEKEAALADVKADGKYTATVEANAIGEATVLTVKTVKEEETK